MSLVTNGQLLTEKKLRDLMDCGLNELVLLLHGVRKETYEALMKGASYDAISHRNSFGDPILTGGTRHMTPTAAESDGAATYCTWR